MSVFSLPCVFCIKSDAHTHAKTVSEPLLEPAPLYQPTADAVLAWHDATYSPHDWPLPRLLLPHPDSTTRAAVFAAALLGGKVLPCMAGSLSGALVAPAASAARPELAGLARVGELLQALQSRQVCVCGLWNDDVAGLWCVCFAALLYCKV